MAELLLMLPALVALAREILAALKARAAAKERERRVSEIVRDAELISGATVRRGDDGLRQFDARFRRSP